MWSVGVITYLLLVGHSPFNTALRIADPNAKEAEVIRLAALGQINTQARAWPGLSPEAREFITDLLQPQCERRLTPTEALRHRWLARQLHPTDATGGTPEGAPAPFPRRDRSARWKFLDGLQRLFWLAFARAQAEPEMVEEPGFGAFLNDGWANGHSYVERLAMELAVAAVPSWFQPDAAWADTLQLAFSYLDVDRDGLLSAPDLLHHFVGEDARDSVDCWVLKWLRKQDAASRFSARGLSFADFRMVLCSQDPVSHGTVRKVDVFREAGGGMASQYQAGSGSDPHVEMRIQAIDSMCQKFLDEEFENHGYGL